ncbi:hypothetical protein EDB80DRAFT_870941 [Ilyonectria destructans]|nr:hypothetical protein EDB80DRAFT_870941 [Ilyonectria destructans]
MPPLKSLLDFSPNGPTVALVLALLLWFCVSGFASLVLLLIFTVTIVCMRLVTLAIGRTMAPWAARQWCYYYTSPYLILDDAFSSHFAGPNPELFCCAGVCRPEPIETQLGDA